MGNTHCQQHCSPSLQRNNFLWNHSFGAPLLFSLGGFGSCISGETSFSSQLVSYVSLNHIRSNIKTCVIYRLSTTKFLSEFSSKYVRDTPLGHFGPFYLFLDQCGPIQPFWAILDPLGQVGPLFVFFSTISEHLGRYKQFSVILTIWGLNGP